MPDITKCHGFGCPFRERCYRAAATPDPNGQSWFMFPPYQPAKTRDPNDQGSCEQFWPIDEAKSTGGSNG